ncbi:MAG: hypothetical protein D8H95_09530 [Lachnospiraceae bacterium]|nr:MAG: hypothetical protein D8H95_09530 [Lachnospiraceae bacterium]
MSVHKVIIYANDYILRVKENTTMNETTSTNRWGSRIRLCLITLLGLSIFFKIGNLILPPVIDINFEDIVTVIIYWIMLLFIYTLFGLVLAPIPTLIMIVLVICILIWFIKGIKSKNHVSESRMQIDDIEQIKKESKEQIFNLSKIESEALEQDEQKESIDLIESESEALEKDEQSQVIDASQSQSSDTKEE